MALSTKQIGILKRADNATKLVVNGYVHQMQNSLDIKKEIPTEIIQIILLFYYFAEYFDIHGDQVEVLGEQKNILQKKDYKGFYNLTFGAVSIPSMSDGIFVWTFEMLDNDSLNNGLVLGIINSKDATIESTKYDATETVEISSYVYCSETNIFCNGLNEDSDYGEELGNIGTIIKMELNMTKGELIYHKNGKSLGVACKVRKSDDIEYKMAVTLYWQGAKFKLVNFECKVL